MTARTAMARTRAKPREGVMTTSTSVALGTLPASPGDGVRMRNRHMPDLALVEQASHWAGHDHCPPSLTGTVKGALRRPPAALDRPSRPIRTGGTTCSG